LGMSAMELLERESAWQELEATLQDAISGDGRVILIGGEAGIGKTTLVERFMRQHKPAIGVLVGRCDALYTPRPLGPLHDIAFQAQGELFSLFSADADRQAIFTACLNMLQKRPLIVVFEDIHWADEATFDLLKYLGRRISGTQALLMATFRDDEISPQHPLRILLGDMATSSATRRIALKPLSVEAVHRLAGNRSVDVAALHRQTGGNPFYVTEVLAAGQSGVPATVRDLVLARAARLSPSARAVLEAAAVIGTRVDPWLLTELAAAEAHAAEECLSSGALLAQDDVFVFRHELVRQIVLESIAPHRRAVLHQMTLDALKASPVARGDLARLAHHAEAANDREAALAYAPPAARQAAAAHAHREAAALYQLALRYADALAPADHAHLLEFYASECFLIDQHHQSLDARRRALAFWQAEGNGLKQGQNLAHITTLLIILGRSAEAEQAVTEAIDLLERLPAGRELALAYRVRATLYLVGRDCPEAIEWAEKALALAEQVGDLTVQATAHNVIGTARLFVDYPRGCDYLEQRLAITHDAGLAAHAATCYANLGTGSGELYQFAAAGRYLAEGIAYCTERDLDYTRLYMLAWQALTFVHQGHWEKAAQIISELLQRSNLAAISRMVTLVALGRLYTRRGDPGAKAALGDALELAMETRSLQRLGPVRAVRAEAAWLAGDYQRAAEEARAAYDLAVSKQHPWFAGELAFWRWRAGDAVDPTSMLAKPFALHIAGDWRAAAAEWQRLGCPYERAGALADGDQPAQVAALDIYDQLGARPAAEALRQRMKATGVRSIPRGPRPTTRENPFGLTPRQMEVLVLLAQELTNAEIASRLHLSVKTVDHHVSAVLAKLDVPDREAAAELAQQNDLL
jgi:DNA-binding CsgD family transcriptional regulator